MTFELTFDTTLTFTPVNEKTKGKRINYHGKCNFYRQNILKSYILDYTFNLRKKHRSDGKQTEFK